MEDELQITLTNDYAFKRLLGSEENKPLLQDLLECILDLSPEDVSKLELMDKELTKEDLSDKTGILDVKLRLKNGSVIDIEIQSSWNVSFVKRTLFYWAKMYTSDFKAGESYDSLHKCIAINIIAELLQKLFHSTVQCIHCISYKKKKSIRCSQMCLKYIFWIYRQQKERKKKVKKRVNGASLSTGLNLSEQAIRRKGL